MSKARRPVVLVTGASRGIGRGIATALAGAGFSVAINYRGNADAAKKTEELCRAAHDRTGRDLFVSDAYDKPSWRSFQADIGSKEDRVRLVDEVHAAYGGIEALVNNAGMAPRQRADLLDASEESFEELIRVNLQGPYFLTQALAARWVAEGSTDAAAGAGSADADVPTSGRTLPKSIVFITSISADTVSVNRGEYCVSKAGLAMTVQLFAARLAANGIGVYEIRPGIMETDMTAGVKDKYDALIASGLVPQMRWGTPEDVGKAVRALVSGEFGFSTGSVVYSDGGFHIARL